MKRLLSMYTYGYPKALTYMLQNTEYEVGPYLRWFWRVKDFTSVMYRRSLDSTKAAILIRTALTAGMFVQFIVGLGLLVLGISSSQVVFTILGTLFVATYPLIWAYLVAVPLFVGRVLIVEPKNRRLISRAEQIFRDHPGTIIAIAGSYGKTSMKELLKTVLSEGKHVAATPGNKNVAVSHAYFASRLTGEEDIVLIEYGEGAPGDVAKFASLSHPNIGVITGLAPAHLDKYPSLQAAGEDIFSLQKYVSANKLYVNEDSAAAKPFIKDDFGTYSSSKVLGWQISDIKVTVSGTRFVMKNAKHRFELKSGLLGKHQVGPLAFVAALGFELGLTEAQIKRGISRTVPYEHRMQPRQVNGAWLIDDTYNGNIDGMKAGLALLASLTAKRRIYVTPGLVDQGSETERVHTELGEVIAKSKPDKVVLMQNSVTDYIQAALKAEGYTGELEIIENPLEYYSNLEHFLAAGDVVLMQNDWTDNYN